MIKSNTHNKDEGDIKGISQSPFERMFERILWNSRYIVLLGVIFGALSAIVLFISGSLEIFNILVEYLFSPESHLTHE
jgi:uncharacterized membrane protein YqhA